MNIIKGWWLPIASSCFSVFAAGQAAHKSMLSGDVPLGQALSRFDCKCARVLCTSVWGWGLLEWLPALSPKWSGICNTPWTTHILFCTEFFWVGLMETSPSGNSNLPRYQVIAGFFWRYSRPPLETVTR